MTIKEVLKQTENGIRDDQPEVLCSVFLYACPYFQIWQQIMTSLSHWSLPARKKVGSVKVLCFPKFFNVGPFKTQENGVYW